MQFTIFLASLATAAVGVSADAWALCACTGLQNQIYQNVTEKACELYPRNEFFGSYDADDHWAGDVASLNITLWWFNEAPLCTARKIDTNDKLGAYLGGDQFTAACQAATAAIAPPCGVALEVKSQCLQSLAYPAPA